MDLKTYIKRHGIDLSKPDTAFQLSHLITEARLFAGITQAELAKLMKTTQSSIARAESGKQEPSVSFLEKVGESVGMKLVLPHWDTPPADTVEGENL